MLIDKYYSYLKKEDLNKAIVVPKEMIIKNSEDNEGWVKWEPVQSNVKNSELESLERKYGLHLPKYYIDFIMSKQFLDIQIGNYTLYGINSLNTLDKVALLLPERILKNGFFPIGNIDDTDYIVLDTNNGKVVRLSFEDYKQEEMLNESFVDLLQFLQKLLENKL